MGIARLDCLNEFAKPKYIHIIILAAFKNRESKVSFSCTSAGTMTCMNMSVLKQGQHFECIGLRLYF